MLINKFNSMIETSYTVSNGIRRLNTRDRALLTEALHSIAALPIDKQWMAANMLWVDGGDKPKGRHVIVEIILAVIHAHQQDGAR